MLKQENLAANLYGLLAQKQRGNYRFFSVCIPIHKLIAKVNKIECYQ